MVFILRKLRPKIIRFSFATTHIASSSEVKNLTTTARTSRRTLARRNGTANADITSSPVVLHKRTIVITSAGRIDAFYYYVAVDKLISYHYHEHNYQTGCKHIRWFHFHSSVVLSFIKLLKYY